jgi:hypothetical protein
VKVRMGLVIALAILAGIFALTRFTSERRPGEKQLFPRYSAEGAARIVLAGSQKQTIMEKDAGVWIVTSEDSFPAEPAAVEAVLDAVNSFSLKDMISSNPDKQSLYQVDSSGISVVIEGAGGETLAAFVVGKVGPDYQSTYIKDSGSDDVILAPGYLRPSYDRGKRPWQDTRVLMLEPGDITEVRITRGEETIALARDEASRWHIALPESAGSDEMRITRLLRTAARLKCDEFAGRSVEPAFGLDHADSSLWLKTADGTEERLLFGSENASGLVYTMRPQADVVYLLAKHKVTSMLPRLAELRKQEPEEGQ